MSSSIVTSPSSQRGLAFAVDIFAAAVRSVGLRFRDWSFSGDARYAIYEDGDSYIGTIEPTDRGLVGDGFSADGRAALLRLIREYDRLLASSTAQSSAVSP